MIDVIYLFFFQKKGRHKKRDRAEAEAERSRKSRVVDGALPDANPSTQLVREHVSMNPFSLNCFFLILLLKNKGC